MKVGDTLSGDSAGYGEVQYRPDFCLYGVVCDDGGVFGQC